MRSGLSAVTLATGWVAAAPLEQHQAAKDVLDELRADAAHQLASGAEGDKLRKLVRHVEYTGRAPSIRAMIEMSKSETGITKQLCEFDANPALLGVVNGVLELNGGKLLPVSPGVLVSKRCRVAFDAGATCARFDQYMAEIQPDEELRRFLQRLVGYCLTGLATEQKFAFLHGSGANGKSVFVELIAWILGDLHPTS